MIRRAPPVFDPDIYRLCNPDIAHLAANDLAEHFRTFGEAEGRRSNALGSREDFAALVAPEARALEIGPYFSPLLHGPNVAYFDVRSRAEMLERAEAEGFDGSTVPEIDYVSATGDLSIVSETFDAVLSSHAIEHQPDLIAHLRDVEGLLRPGGAYYVLAPDKRYCFDHFIPESTVAHIVQAHADGRTAHALASVVEHYALTTHNECPRHWAGDHGTFMQDGAPRTRAGIAAYEAANGGYLDVHAWYFTPDSARVVFPTLRELDYTTLELERLYPTRFNTFEFWFILRKPA